MGIPNMLWWNLLLYGWLWYFSSRVSGQGDNKWTTQLQELKSMLMVLDSRMLKIESKFGELNFLEGAFKINNIDDSLKRIDTSAMLMDARMNRLEVQVDTIKNLLKNLSGPSPCKEVQMERVSAPPQNSGRGGGGTKNPVCGDLTEKVEDYSYKLTKSQQELKESSQQHQQALGNLLDTVRNGFTKTFQKVDALPSAERQLARMSSSISRISNQYPETLEKLTSISDILSLLQSDLARTMGKISSSASVSEDRISATLTHAIAFGNQVKEDLSGLTKIEPEITKAAAMAKDLLIGLDNHRRPTSLEILKNLTITLEDMERTVNPLLFSMTHNFDGIHELLETTLGSMHKNHTTACNFQEVFKLELKRLKESIEKQNSGQCLVSTGHENVQGSKSGNIQDAVSVMKQKDVFDNLGYVNAVVSLIRMDLKELFKNCPDGSIRSPKSLGLVMG